MRGVLEAAGADVGGDASGGAGGVVPEAQAGDESMAAVIMDGDLTTEVAGVVLAAATPRQRRLRLRMQQAVTAAAMEEQRRLRRR